MTSPFITCAELTAALVSATPPAILDASFVLHPAAFDGDYRTDNGESRFVERHIPGAQHVDVATEFSAVGAAQHYTHQSPQQIADSLAARGIGAADAVVIYDSTGGLFAARLWYLLSWIGVDARVLDGGLAAWERFGNPVASGLDAAVAALPRWTASAVREAWISKEELTERTADDTRPLVCALPAASFSGADATRYSRRGHIPGSVNVSARDLFSVEGTVIAENELREAFGAQGVTGDDEVLLYCGGGISASANALTLAALGVTAVRIYDGSLEEWSADPDLPLTVG